MLHPTEPKVTNDDYDKIGTIHLEPGESEYGANFGRSHFFDGQNNCGKMILMIYDINSYKLLFDPTTTLHRDGLPHRV